MERTRVISTSMANEAIKTCEELGFVGSRIKSGVIADIPGWKEYVFSLPSHGAKESIDKFRILLENIGLTLGTKKFKRISGRFTIWETGEIRFTTAKPPKRKKRPISEDAFDHRLPGHYGANQ